MKALLILFTILLSISDDNIVMQLQEQGPENLLADPQSLLQEGSKREEQINKLAPKGEWLEWDGDAICYNIKDAYGVNHPTCEKKMCIKKTYLYLFSSRIFCRRILSSNIQVLSFSLPVDLVELFLNNSVIYDSNDPASSDYLAS